MSSLSIPIENIEGLFNKIVSKNEVSISFENLSKFMEENKISSNVMGNKLGILGNLDLPDFISTVKESLKTLGKNKSLLKHKIDRYTNAKINLEKDLKFNKFELKFILDKKVSKNEKIHHCYNVKVENDNNHELFVLDNNEIICKLKLLNSKEKFKISVFKIELDVDSNSNVNTNLNETNDYSQNPIIEVFYLDLNEVFGTEKINVEKNYEKYKLLIELNINDKRQADLYLNLKSTLKMLKKSISNYNEIEAFINSITSKKVNYLETFRQISLLFRIEESGLEIINENEMTKNHAKKRSYDLDKSKLDEFSFKCAINESKEIETKNLNNKIDVSLNSSQILYEEGARKTSKFNTQKSQNPLENLSSNKKLHAPNIRKTITPKSFNLFDKTKFNSNVNTNINTNTNANTNMNTSQTNLSRDYSNANETINESFLENIQNITLNDENFEGDFSKL